MRDLDIKKKARRKYGTDTVKMFKEYSSCRKKYPIPALYMEMGIMPLKYQMDIRKLNYFHRILQVEESRWQKIFLYEQIQSLELRNNIGQEWFRLMQKYEMWFTLEELRDISKERWKNIVQEKVEMKAEDEIIGRARKMKKTGRIMQI